MIDDSLQEQAALYAAGTLSATEREHFELILRFHTELRALVVALEEVAAAAITAPLAAGAPGPSAGLRARVLAGIAGRAQQTSDEGFVMTGPDGLVQWVNPAFTAMCGYELAELRGKKLGSVLQGAQTDRTTAERMGRAVRENRACTETILNYHKNGQPYWVEIAITPLLDDAGATRWFVAREREVPEQAAA
ncbi:MAG: PAS domain-containing protein [Chthoniobacter sp.]|nr:PAS domain-containing protein [Chthoniobacter sp.]